MEESNQDKASKSEDNALLTDEEKARVKKAKKNKQKKMKQKAKKKLEKGGEIVEKFNHEKKNDKQNNLVDNLEISKYLQSVNAPVHIEYNHKKGRHLVSSTDIQKGDAIFEMKPYAGVVYDSFVEDRCHKCFGTADVYLLCGGCKHARFCSTSCMNAATKLHKLECRTLGRLEELKIVGETAPWRLLIRLVYQKYYEDLEKQDVEESSGIKAKLQKKLRDMSINSKKNLCFNDVLDLLSHEDKVDRANKASIVSILVSLTDMLDENASLPLDVMTNIIYKLQVNAHTVMDENRQIIALGLYPAVSYLNHSCLPNCCVVFKNNGICSVHALRDISSGVEVNDAYIDLYDTKANRIETLRTRYYLDDCDCARCQTPLPISKDRYMGGVICKACKALLKVWEQGEKEVIICSECSEENKGLVIEHHLNVARQQFQRGLIELRKGTKEGVENTRKLLKDELVESSCKDYLHPYHCLMFKSYLLLGGACNSAQDYEGQVNYCSKVVEALRFCFDDEHPELGTSLFKLGQGYELLAKSKAKVLNETKDSLLKKAKQAYEESFMIHNNCCGKDYHVTKLLSKKLTDLSDSEQQQKKGKAKRKGKKKH